VAVAGSGGSDIWIYDVRSRTLQRLTRIGGDRPEWSADGSRVLFRHQADGGGEQIWWQPSDGSAPAEPLQATPRTVPEAVMSADGRYLVYRVNAPITGRDIWYRAMSGDTTSRPLVATNEEELMPRLSPDGRWLAYVSTASGIREVYVQRFPGPGAVVQISTGGGDEPLWSRDGRRLYYRNAPAFIAAAVAPEGDRMRVLSRTSVHEGPYPIGSVHPTWDVAPDGRLLVLEAAGDQSQLVVVHDWRTELLARLNAPR
jgi:Tol biopolymer transport system component